MAGFTDRLKHAWDAFTDNEKPDYGLYSPGTFGTTSYGSHYDPRVTRVTNERSIISSIYNRLAIDVGQIEIRHVKVDDEQRYLHDVASGLNSCLTIEANLDQAATNFRMDIAYTLFDHGVAAIVPVETSLNPKYTEGYDIKTLRVGPITQWYPNHVRVDLYNEKIGKRQEIVLEKKMVAIVQNPLYTVMNEPNSTLQRLTRKLSLLDVVDEQSSSGKLDIIIQLPYVIKSEARRAQAEQRRKDIEVQLAGSQYGIAYTDGTEKITQLNRPAENNLLNQVQYLTQMLYGQLGLTEEIMNGTADEKAMLNYQNRTILPIVNAVTEELRRKFLTKTARTQNHWIMYLRDPFTLVPINQIAEIADKFTRNEILTSNEIRQIVGRKPAKDPEADKLKNSNMPSPSEPAEPTKPIEEGDSQNGS